jgi:hypothetical protein
MTWMPLIYPVPGTATLQTGGDCRDGEAAGQDEGSGGNGREGTLFELTQQEVAQQAVPLGCQRAGHNLREGKLEVEALGRSM